MALARRTYDNANYNIAHSVNDVHISGTGDVTVDAGSFRLNSVQVDQVDNETIQSNIHSWQTCTQ